MGFRLVGRVGNVYKTMTSACSFAHGPSSCGTIKIVEGEPPEKQMLFVTCFTLKVIAVCANGVPQNMGLTSKTGQLRLILGRMNLVTLAGRFSHFQ